MPRTAAWKCRTSDFKEIVSGASESHGEEEESFVVMTRAKRDRFVERLAELY